MIKVTVWNEYEHERTIPAIRDIYPEGIHGALKAVLYEETDMIVLPGGMGGRDNMAASEGLTDLLRKLMEEDKKIAAICAAPTVLGRLGALEGVECLCYPDPELESELKGRVVPKGNARTITDGSFTTSSGPATAMEFGLELVNVLKGKATADQVAAGMLYK